MLTRSVLDKEVASQVIVRPLNELWAILYRSESPEGHELADEKVINIDDASSFYKKSLATLIIN